MSRTLISLPASPDPTFFTKTTHYDPMKNTLDLLMLGVISRNQYWGGDDVTPIFSASVVDAIGQGDGFEIDNTNSQISGSASIIVQVRLRIRVGNVGVSVTPQVYNVTTSAVATTSGAAACAATNEDFSGTNQQQTLALTLAAGINKYKVRFTPTNAIYPVWVSGIVSDIYVNV